VKTRATQRSLELLRKNGWTVHIVEKYIKHPNMAFGKRIDVYNFGDLLACRPPTQGLPGSIALVQCCPGASHAEHKDKILGIPEFEIWKAAGGRVFLQSWAKKGARGEKKRWTMREEEL